MKYVHKFLVLILMFFLAMLVAGLYGALHNQISYTFSPEYFTKFKFEQYGVNWGYEHPRIGAAYVPDISSWWMGKWIFMFLGPVGLIFSSAKQMAIQLSKSFLVVAVVALTTGLLGLLYGVYEVTPQNIGGFMEWVHDGVVDSVWFVRVGYMHDASYYGAETGLVAGVVYLVGSRVWLRYNKAMNFVPG